jgi:hypothetical protein
MLSTVYASKIEGCPIAPSQGGRGTGRVPWEMQKNLFIYIYAKGDTIRVLPVGIQTSVYKETTT